MFNRLFLCDDQADLVRLPHLPNIKDRIYL